MRGRVLAVDRATSPAMAVVRGERADTRVAVPDGANWRAGDLVDHATVVREGLAPDFPGLTTETLRMPRARVSNVHARANALRAVRAFFDGRDFVEVETPLLVKSPGLEVHLDAVRAGDGGYLITSPEYQMKRLLAAGFERIYQVCKCFRGNERGAHHNGEFTMVEWYRGFDGLEAIAKDTEELVAHVVRTVSGSEFARAGSKPIDVTPPWLRMTVRDAMKRWAGIEVHGDEPELRTVVRAAGIDVADDAAWDDAFFAAFLARVEPGMVELQRPIFLEDWPAPLAALARRRADDPLTALRFEAYVGGIELANAFGELTDPLEQRARFEEDLRVRRARGRATYPIDDKLLAALAEGVPPSGGIALGFDRLVMLATGAERIDDVLAFTAEEL